MIPDTTGGATMAEPQPAPGRHLAPPTPPTWLVDLLEVLDHRRVMVMRTALGILAVGLLASLVAPSVLPPTVLVGLLVGLAAVVIAAAVAFALDSAEPVLRGSRHVRGAGGEVLVEGRNTPETAELLAQRLGIEVATTETGSYGFIELGTDHALTHAMLEAVADAMAEDGNRVIQVDLTTVGDGDGVSEVILNKAPLSRAVQFSPTGRTQASISSGRDLDHAWRHLPTFLRNLPTDIDTVLVALPTVATTTSVAPEGLERVFVLAVRGVSRSLDLVATLEKYDRDGIQTHVLLLDPKAGSTGGIAPLATEAVADPLLTEGDEVAPLAVDAADHTAPVPRVEPHAQPDGHAEDLTEDIPAPSGPLGGGGGPKPLSPELAARLQRQNQLQQADAEQQDLQAPAPADPVAPPAPVVGGWTARPGGADDASTPPHPDPARPDAPTAAAPASDVAAPEADDLDPDLLAAALASGELDALDTPDGVNEDLDDLAPPAADAQPAPDAEPGPSAGPGAAGGQPGAGGTAAPQPPIASRGDQPKPGSITGGLGQQFRQRLPGRADDVDADPRNLAAQPVNADGAAAVGEGSTTLVVDEPAPAIIELDHAQDVAVVSTTALDPEFTAPLDLALRDVALGAADEDDDDPLGMTAALHSFTLERLEVEDESDEDA